MNGEGGEPKGTLAVRTQRLRPTRLGPAASPARLELQPRLRAGRTPTPSRTHITPSGPEEGDCMLRDEVVAETHHWDSDADPPRVRQARPRSAGTPGALRLLGAAKARWLPSKTMQKRIRFRQTHGVCNAVSSVCRSYRL